MIVTTQVPDVVAEQLAAVAAARGTSRSAFMREAILKHLADAAPPPVRVRQRHELRRKPDTRS